MAWAFRLGRFDRQGHNAHINRPVFQLFHNLVAEVSINADLYARIEAGELGEDVGQNIKACRLVRPDHQRAARELPLVRHREQRLIPHLQETLRIGEQHPARRGQGHIFARTVEQPVPVFLLQLPDLRADGGLRPKDLQAGARKAAKLRDFQKGD